MKDNIKEFCSLVGVEETGDNFVLTEDKQFRLIQYLSSMSTFKSYLGITGRYHMSCFNVSVADYSTSRALAQLVCACWDSLTEEAHTRIKEIIGG